MTLTEELMLYLKQLNESQQERLINFARSLTQSHLIVGESGASIIQATGYFDLESLDEMEKAIDENCERIDWREWE